jgi:nucleotide-binding universal stress UspA family protein
MFKHLLVPLDGSALAESALPAAAYFANIFGASVTLLHIVERNAPKEVHQERHLREAQEAQGYLEEVTKRLFPAQIQVAQHVHTTLEIDVPRSIAEHASELKPDLIVMCTHGSSGVRGLLFGSIAQQVIGIGKTPVLLIRPDATNPLVEFICQKLLLPLDGSLEHEQSIPVGVAIARACQAELYLMMAVHTYSTLSGEQAAAGQLMPGAMSVMLDLAEMGGEEYLRRHLLALQNSGLSIKAEVARGDPVKIIEKIAKRVGSDLIVLGTHGKSGMDAFWSGSTAPKLSSRTKIPLLLVPVHDHAEN